jgi:hypothetical protein
MYDRQTFTWWQQFTGEAIVGDLTGDQLQVLPSQIIAWSDFKEYHAQSEVLSRDTGHVRSYGLNPYAGYDSVNSSPFFPLELTDERLRPMERVVALKVGDAYMAYPFDPLSEARVVNDEVEDQPLVVFWKEGTVSTFGNNGPDTGSTGAFSRDLNGEVLTFVWEGDSFRDEQTSSTWNLLGQAVAGPLAGSQLERLVSAEHFWFAWVVFRPDTVVWSP